MAPVTDFDVLLNQSNISLARSQRIIASWLPPRDPSATEATKTDADFEGEESGAFVAEPELLGVGAKPPQDGQVRREELSSNDKLRKQLLGKDYDRKRKREEAETKKGYSLGSKPRAQPQSRPMGDGSEEEEEGRSALGKKLQKRQEANRNTVGEAEEIEEMVVPGETAAVGRLKDRQWTPRGSSYLDEVLAEKARKKRKKNRRKHKALTE